MEAKNVINGLWGSLWLDGEEIAEVIACQGKDEYETEEIKMARKMHKGIKIIGITSKGSVTMHKVNSRMIQKINRLVRDGKTPEFTIISKLADPDTLGCERIAFLGVVFTDLTYADWELGTVGKIECPFFYRDTTRLDVIQ